MCFLFTSTGRQRNLTALSCLHSGLRCNSKVRARYSGCSARLARTLAMGRLRGTSIGVEEKREKKLKILYIFVSLQSSLAGRQQNPRGMPPPPPPEQVVDTTSLEAEITNTITIKMATPTPTSSSRTPETNDTNADSQTPSPAQRPTTPPLKLAPRDPLEAAWETVLSRVIAVHMVRCRHYGVSAFLARSACLDNDCRRRHAASAMGAPATSLPCRMLSPARAHSLPRLC